MAPHKWEIEQEPSARTLFAAGRQHIAGIAMTAEAVISSETFKQTMRLLAGGVCIAASSLDGTPLGLTVTAVCSLTLDPPTLILCVNQTAGAHDMMRATKRVSINFLASHQIELAELFSSPHIRGNERFVRSKWADMSSGAPAAIDALAALDCEIVNEMNVGQHTLFICEVKLAKLETEKYPLVHFNRSFCELSPIA